MGEVGKPPLSSQPSPALCLRVTGVYAWTRPGSGQQRTADKDPRVQGALSVSAAQAQESGDRSPIDSISLGLTLAPPPTVAGMTVGAVPRSQQCKGHKGGGQGTGQEGQWPL